MTDKPIEVALPDTPEWQEARQTGFGASDAPAILGVSPYRDAFQVYQEKRGNVPPFAGNEFTERGKWLERPLLEKTFTEFINPVAMHRHPTHQFMLATPDALLPDGGAEIKTLEPHNAKRVAELGEENTDAIPDDWQVQIQQQCAVMGWEVVSLVVLVGYRIRLYKVHRNEDLIEIIRKREDELWQRVQDGKCPEPNWGHAATADFVRQLYGVDEEKTVDLPSCVVDMWHEQEAIGKRVRMLERERKKLRSQVLYTMGDAGVGHLDNEYELVRREIAETAIPAQTRKSYVRLSQRKRKT